MKGLGARTKNLCKRIANGTLDAVTEAKSVILAIN